jgi:hypothetical protein
MASLCKVSSSAAGRQIIDFLVFNELALKMRRGSIHASDAHRGARLDLAAHPALDIISVAA